MMNLKQLITLSFVLIFGMLVSSCESPVAPDQSLETSTMNVVTSLAKGTDCAPVIEQFRAGQHIDIGAVSIWDDSTNLYVQFNAEYGWELQHTHVNISADSIVVNGTTYDPSDGRPAPGHYTIQTAHDPRVTTYTYTFPLADYPGSTIYVLTHAEAISPTGGGETGYGGDLENTGRGWWYYSRYSVGDGCEPGDDDDNDPELTFSVNGSVFLDTNEDGLLDAGENGVAGITVELLDADGNVVATATTDSNGNYNFTNVPNSDYTVVVDPEGTLAGLSSTTGSNGAISVDGADVTVDFGYALPNVSGTVFFDLNKDGMQNPGEAGIAGITVTLSDGSTTVTDADGNYIFENVLPGTYTVDVDPEGTLAGLTSSTSISQSIDVGYADVNDVDFGYELPVVSGVVFFDVTADGSQNIDELGIDNITVTLLDEFGNTVATTTTDENGFYEFEVYPGDYTVVAEGPDGLMATTPVSVDTTVGYADETVDFGFELDFTYIPGQIADGFTIGYWKNNLSKAISGKTRGTQVNAATLAEYVYLLSDFALYPLNVTSYDEAYEILSANGSDPVLLLSKQLMGSEFNLMNEAYIGGNETFTEMFLYYGEYLITHADQFTASEILEAKDWYDAYNNSHGGEIIF
ncbi:SdrD B-like domain-containing protein [Candidatus Neomarinimicrobiota bacterium]